MGKLGETTPQNSAEATLDINQQEYLLASAEIDADHKMHLILHDPRRYDELEIFLNHLHLDFRIEDDIPNAFSFERNENGNGVTITLIETTGEKMLGYIDENHLRPLPQITAPSPR